MTNKTDVIVIGGGASGMIAAIVCARQNKSVTILEHNDKLGRKLLATGNGKCNYTNENQGFDFYHTENKQILERVFSQFDKESTLTFFKELGIYPKVKNGYYYPYSEQASSIVEVLRLELEYVKVKIKLKQHIIHIEKLPDGFKIFTDNYAYFSDKVILATGGMAASALGSDGSGYRLAKELGHSITKIYSGLTGLKVKESFFSKLAGIRVKAVVSLIIANEVFSQEQGEVQLTSYGISGIPVFQLSRFAAIAIANQKQVFVKLDFMPNYNRHELICMLQDLADKNGYKTIKELLIGFFDTKLCHLFIEKSKINKQIKSKDVTQKQWNNLVNTIKEFSCEIKAVNNLEQAQVTVGGVSCEEVNNETLESKLTKGLYFAGELIDVDAACGGYNLQWAWSTGFVAGYYAGLEGISKL